MRVIEPVSWSTPVRRWHPEDKLKYSWFSPPGLRWDANYSISQDSFHFRIPSILFRVRPVSVLSSLIFVELNRPRSFFWPGAPLTLSAPSETCLCNNNNLFNMYIKPAVLLSFLGAVQALVAPRILQFDDVIVPNDDGSYSVMKDFEYGIQKSKREMLNKRAIHSPPTAPSVAALDKRCDESTEVQVLTDTNFNNWDVAMSPVIANTGSNTATVAVTKGYSISNSLAVSIPYSCITTQSRTPPTNNLP